MGRLHLGTLVLLLALLILAACTDDPEPRVADPTTPAPSPTTASSQPVTIPPTSPPTSDPPADETAEEFIRRWQETANEMQKTGSGAEFLALAADCGPCVKFANRVERIYRLGGFIDTDGSDVLDVKRWGKIDSWPTFDADMRSAPTRYSEASGSRVVSLPGGAQTLRISLERVQSAWVVRSYGRVVS